MSHISCQSLAQMGHYLLKLNDIPGSLICMSSRIQLFKDPILCIVDFSNSNNCTEILARLFSATKLISIAEVSGSTKATDNITAVKDVSPKSVSRLSSTTISASTISANSPRVIPPRTSDDLNNDANAKNSTNAVLSTDLVIDMDQVYIQ